MVINVTSFFKPAMTRQAMAQRIAAPSAVVAFDAILAGVADSYRHVDVDAYAMTIRSYMWSAGGGS